MTIKHLKLIAFSISLYLGVIFIQRLGALLTGLLTDDKVMLKLGENLSGMLFVLVAMLVLKMTRDIYWLSQAAVKKWYLFLLPMAYILVGFDDFYGHTTEHVIAAVFSTLSTGVMEEVLCRGMVLAIFIKGYKQMGMADYLLKAVLMSSALFGLAHLANTVGQGHAAGAVIGQAFYATFIGVGFCAVYLHTKSILPLVFIHTGINFVSFLSDAPDAVKTASFIDTIPAIIICAPLFIYGFILLKKKTQQDLGLDIK